MPAAWIAAAGGVLGAMNSGNGGGGTTTQTKDPWAPAQPWLTSNLGIGQNLQSQYAANPFNQIQQASYANLLGQNDYINQMMPGLLSQFSQSQGFDRNNPTAKPQAYRFPTMQPSSYQPTAGLLAPSLAAARAQPAVAAPAPAQQYVTGLFGTVPAPADIPGTTSPALPPTTWQQWMAGLNTSGSN